MEALKEVLIKTHHKEFKELVISPDDKEVLVVFGNQDEPVNNNFAYDYRNRSISKLNISTGELKELIPKEDEGYAPSWSHDGNQIAFISNCSGQDEIWIMDKEGMNKRKLTHSSFQGYDPFYETKLFWSKNDEYIVYSTVPNGSRMGLYTTFLNEYPDNNDIEIDTARFETFNKNMNEYYARLVGEIHLVKTLTGEEIILHRKEGVSFQLIEWWSDEEILVSDGGNLSTIHITTGESSTIFSGQIGIVKSYNSNILMGNLQTRNNLIIGRIDDKELNKIQETLIPGEEITLHTFSNNGQLLYFSSRHGLSKCLYSIDVKTGEIRQLTEMGKTIYSFSHRAHPQVLHNNQTILFPYGGPNEPKELYKIDKVGCPERISSFNREVNSIQKPDVKVIEYKSEGFSIESMLVVPPNYDQNKKYPTLVYCHGGPEYYVEACFSGVNSARAQSAAIFLALNGYVVLLPNFRGSAGYGEEFLNHLGNNNLAQVPYRDIIAGVDYLIEEGIADGNKLGVYGSSYGALLTAWTITQTNRFKAAVCSVGVRYDLLQGDRQYGKPFYAWKKNRLGESDPKALWNNIDVYKGISPIEHVSSVKTPTLLIETKGERPNGYSLSQSFFYGLLENGVKATRVYYPNAYHTGAWNDDYKSDYLQRLVDWFDQNVLEKESRKVLK